MPPPYPRTKPEKDSLYAATAAGITANPTEYPSGLGGLFANTLAAKITAKTTALNDRIAKEAAFRLAVTAENAAYAACDLEERRILTLAEAQYEVSAPDKLLLIGWGPRSAPQSVVPGQPRDLSAFPQDQTSLTLKWKAPIPNSGGTVNFYRIERETRTLAGVVTEEFGVWSTQSVRVTVALSGLTRGVEYRFRVVAVNAAGDSADSNTVAAVL